MAKKNRIGTGIFSFFTFLLKKREKEKRLLESERVVESVREKERVREKEESGSGKVKIDETTEKKLKNFLY